MRIISGKSKGIKLDTPVGINTRPTADRVKEAIFSIIQFDINDAIIFEPFAGSGQLSIESLSRNAQFAYINDNDYIAISIIKNNVKKAQFENNCAIYNLPFEKAINKVKLLPKIDIIFLDPPYAGNILNEALQLIDENINLTDNSLIICEHSLDNPPVSIYNNFVLIKSYRYSKTGVSLFKHS